MHSKSDIQGYLKDKKHLIFGGLFPLGATPPPPSFTYLFFSRLTLHMWWHVWFPVFIILHHGTNDLNGNSTSEEIADKILHLAASIKTSKNQVFVSSLVIRKDKLNKKGNEANELLKNVECVIRQLSLSDNKNISLGMLNKSGIYLNNYGTTHLVNNFCFSMTA